MRRCRISSVARWIAGDGILPIARPVAAVAGLTVSPLRRVVTRHRTARLTQRTRRSVRGRRLGRRSMYRCRRTASRPWTAGGRLQWPLALRRCGIGNTCLVTTRRRLGRLSPGGVWRRVRRTHAVRADRPTDAHPGRRPDCTLMPRAVGLARAVCRISNVNAFRGRATVSVGGAHGRIGAMLRPVAVLVGRMVIRAVAVDRIAVMLRAAAGLLRRRPVVFARGPVVGERASRVLSRGRRLGRRRRTRHRVRRRRRIARMRSSTGRFGTAVNCRRSLMRRRWCRGLTSRTVVRRRRFCHPRRVRARSRR